MMLFSKKRRQKRNTEIAREVVKHLENSGRGWEKFLPPVVLEGRIYMVTDHGSIYEMKKDDSSNMEIITQIRVG